MGLHQKNPPGSSAGGVLHVSGASMPIQQSRATRHPRSALPSQKTGAGGKSFEFEVLAKNGNATNQSDPGRSRKKNSSDITGTERLRVDDHVPHVTEVSSDEEQEQVEGTAGRVRPPNSDRARGNGLGGVTKSLGTAQGVSPLGRTNGELAGSGRRADPAAKSKDGTSRTARPALSQASRLSPRIADTVPSSSLRTGAPSKSNVETCYLLTRGVGPGESSACTVKCHRAHIASMSGGRCLELSGPIGDLLLPLTSIEMCQYSTGRNHPFMEFDIKNVPQRVFEEGIERDSHVLRIVSRDLPILRCIIRLKPASFDDANAASLRDLFEEMRQHLHIWPGQEHSSPKARRYMAELDKMVAASNQDWNPQVQPPDTQNSMQDKANRVKRPVSVANNSIAQQCDSSAFDIPSGVEAERPDQGSRSAAVKADQAPAGRASKKNGSIATAEAGGKHIAGQGSLDKYLPAAATGAIPTQARTSRRLREKGTAQPSMKEVEEEDDEVDVLPNGPSAPQLKQVPRPVNPNNVLFPYPLEGPPRIAITEGDKYRLPSGDFLNDTLLEFGLSHVLSTAASRGPTGPEGASEKVLDMDRVHLFNSFFYEKLSSKALEFSSQRQATNEEGHWLPYDAVRKWTKNTDVFSKRLIIVPINEFAHWYLAIIYNPSGILESQAQIASESATGHGMATTRESSSFSSAPADGAIEEEEEELVEEKRAELRSHNSLRTPRNVDPGAASTNADSPTSSSLDVTGEAGSGRPSPSSVFESSRATSPDPLDCCDRPDPPDHEIASSDLAFATAKLSETSLQNALDNTSGDDVDMEGDHNSPPSISVGPVPVVSSSPGRPIEAPCLEYFHRQVSKQEEEATATSAPLAEESTVAQAFAKSDIGQSEPVATQAGFLSLAGRLESRRRLLNSDKTWIITFDSLGGQHKGVTNNLYRWLACEARTRKGVNVDVTNLLHVPYEAPVSSSYMLVRRPQESQQNSAVDNQVPKQPNFSDCGLYLIHFTERLLNHFHQVMSFIEIKKSAMTATKKLDYKPFYHKELARVWDEEGTRCLRDLWTAKIDSLAEEYAARRQNMASPAAKSPSAGGEVTGDAQGDDSVQIVENGGEEAPNSALTSPSKAHASEGGGLQSAVDTSNATENPFRLLLAGDALGAATGTASAASLSTDLVASDAGPKLDSGQIRSPVTAGTDLRERQKLNSRETVAHGQGQLLVSPEIHGEQVEDIGCCGDTPEITKSNVSTATALDSHTPQPKVDPQTSRDDVESASAIEPELGKSNDLYDATGLHGPILDSELAKAASRAHSPLPAASDISQNPRPQEPALPERADLSQTSPSHPKGSPRLARQRNSSPLFRQTDPDEQLASSPLATFPKASSRTAGREVSPGLATHGLLPKVGHHPDLLKDALSAPNMTLGGQNDSASRLESVLQGVPAEAVARHASELAAHLVAGGQDKSPAASSTYSTFGLPVVTLLTTTGAPDKPTASLKREHRGSMAGDAKRRKVRAGEEAVHEKRNLAVEPGDQFMEDVVLEGGEIVDIGQPIPRPASSFDASTTVQGRFNETSISTESPTSRAATGREPRSSSRPSSIKRNLDTDDHETQGSKRHAKRGVTTAVVQLPSTASTSFTSRTDVEAHNDENDRNPAGRSASRVQSKKKTVAVVRLPTTVIESRKVYDILDSDSSETEVAQDRRGTHRYADEPSLDPPPRKRSAATNDGREPFVKSGINYVQSTLAPLSRSGKVESMTPSRSKRIAAQHEGKVTPGRMEHKRLDNKERQVGGLGKNRELAISVDEDDD